MVNFDPVDSSRHSRGTAGDRYVFFYFLEIVHAVGGNFVKSVRFVIILHTCSIKGFIVS